MKDIHILIHDDIDERLEKVATAESSKKSILVREALAEYVARKEQELVQKDMRQYAEQMTSASGTLAAETAQHVEKILTRDTSW